jgi:hypothetical protein
MDGSEGPCLVEVSRHKKEKKRKEKKKNIW